MKKKISLVVIFILLATFLFATFCYATEIQPRTGENQVEPISETGEAVTTSETEDTTTDGEVQQEPEFIITYSDVFVVEQQDYESDELIDGNAYIMVDGNFKFTGEINGSAYILCTGTVEFSEESYIADSLYIFAKEIKVGGAIYDIYALTQNFEILNTAYISRDVNVITENAKLRGTIYRNVNLTADTIDVQDEVESLRIGQDFNYTSLQEVEGIEDVVLYGNVNFTQKENIEVEEEIPSVGEMISDYVVSAITSIIYVLAIYLGIKGIAPNFADRVGTDLKQKGIVAFAIGLLSWVIAIILFVILFALLFTIGAPISILLLLAMTIVMYISSAVVSIAVLEMIKEKSEKIKNNKLLTILVLAGIALVIWGLQEIPYIGGLCGVIVVTTGIGLTVRNSIAKREEVKEEAKAE